VPAALWRRASLSSRRKGVGSERECVDRQRERVLREREIKTCGLVEARLALLETSRPLPHLRQLPLQPLRLRSDVEIGLVFIVYCLLFTIHYSMFIVYWSAPACPPTPAPPFGPSGV